MECPVCKRSVKDFRQHAFNHVRADEAYAVEIWDPGTASTKLVLYPLLAPLGPGETKSLLQQLDRPNTRLITSGRLRMLERRRKAAK